MKVLLPKCSDKQIIDAWNALLLEIPQENIQLLEKLSKKYKLYLLSNTNSIHIERINEQLYKKYNFKNLNPLFDTVFLSHEIGMRKPNTDTFEYVLDEAGINANETLFIEDSIQHIESANNVGIQTRLWESNKPLSGLFPDKAL
jgi:putative hydrolase of the HAD superfamily